MLSGIYYCPVDLYTIYDLIYEDIGHNFTSF